MILALSMTSSRALMALYDECAESLFAAREWDNHDGSELAESLGRHYAALCAEAPVPARTPQLTKIFGVEGPGSFTGLRVSSAFLKGLATALGVPLVGISSFDLFGEDFAFSLRPAKAAQLTLAECLEREYKFLQIEKDSARVVAVPTASRILGLKGDPFWPQLSELQRGLKASLAKKAFTLNYGYAPEFVSLLKSS